jgi:hypothetical protein
MQKLIRTFIDNKFYTTNLSRLNSTNSQEITQKNTVLTNDSSEPKLHVPVMLNEVLKYIVEETPQFQVESDFY